MYNALKTMNVNMILAYIDDVKQKQKERRKKSFNFDKLI